MPDSADHTKCRNTKSRVIEVEADLSQLKVPFMWIHRNCSFKSFRWHSIPIYIIVLTIWVCAAAHAQRPGVLEGRVMDPSGAVIPGALVLVVPQPSGRSQTVQTNGEGRYRITGLTPGQYKVTGEASGFQTVVKEAAMAVDKRQIHL